VDFHDLREFVALADTLNYTKAAQSLSMSRSSLILHVSKLEKQLGSPFFYKSSQKLSLTVPGQLFLDYARQILQLCDAGAAALQDQRESVDRHVKVAYSDVPDLFGLPEILKQFRQNDQNLECETMEVSPDQLPSLLETGQCDLFLYWALPNHPIALEQFQSESYLSDALVVLLPDTHWLTRFRRIPLSSLNQESLILKNDSASITFVKTTCQPSGVNPIITHTLRPLESIIEMVDSHCGNTLLPNRIARSIDLDNVRARPFNPPVPSELLLVWRKDVPLCTAGMHFVRCAQAYGEAQAAILAAPPAKKSRKSKSSTSTSSRNRNVVQFSRRCEADPSMECIIPI
jgi:DNA-binding transcriptional LysR family regulator